MLNNTTQILGIKFHSGTPAGAADAGLRGGLVVVPSAPVLVDMAGKAALRQALQEADLALPDSGFMVLLWRLQGRERIERVSGLEYLRLLLGKLQPEAGSRELGAGSGVFWVMPTETARDRNLAWLRGQGFALTADDCYVAPMYPADGPIVDAQLSVILQRRKPAHIILALGGGTQERLGLYLRQSLAKPETGDPRPGELAPQSAWPTGAYRPGIHCIGAAIGFLSGEQVRIPMWADYLYLGWLWRSLSAPRRFLPRYWKALRLAGLIFRYGAKPPR